MTRLRRSDELVKAVVREYWNGRAPEYDFDGISGVHTETQREAWLSTLRTLTGDGTSRVLDVGCGTGTVSLLLADLGYDVTGVDISPRMLERARLKAADVGHSIEFHTGDAERLPFPQNAFDVVTARHLIWTLPKPATAIEEWRRVVRPGGRLVLVEGYWDFPEPWEEYREIHEKLPLYDGRPPSELVEFLLDQGLETVECESMMDPTYWGREPEQELYAVTISLPS